jgi:hypothetical protein
LATARVEISANGPGAAPGDQLNLALAGVQNQFIVHGSSGSVSSSNRQTLTWTGMEQSTQPIDAVAPGAANAHINLDGVPGPGKVQVRQQAIDVQFGEDIGLISPASLVLTNLTTGQAVPQANIAVTFDASTKTAHFTFPGYPGGILPNGNYHGVLPASQTTDAFGNSLAADVAFDFFFLQGDANHDRRVDVTDLGILATNWQGTNKTFSQGDFNYDGVVDVSDLGILATGWQSSLPIPGASSVAVGGSVFAKSRRELSRITDELLA